MKRNKTPFSSQQIQLELKVSRVSKEVIVSDNMVCFIFKTHKTLLSAPPLWGACLSHSISEPQIFSEHYCIGCLGGKKEPTALGLLERIQLFLGGPGSPVFLLKVS